MKKKWDRVSVLYTDTDSLVLEIETEDFFADIAADVKEWFDTNDFSPEHPAVLNGMPIVPENKKKIGLMKDECCGAVMTEFVALKPKLYSFLTEEDEKIREKQKAKGVKKCIIKKSLRHENFVKCLNTGQSQMRKQSFFRSREHHLFTESLTKLALNPRDDKSESFWKMELTLWLWGIGGLRKFVLLRGEMGNGEWPFFKTYFLC